MSNQYCPDNEEMERIIYSLHKQCENAANGYIRVIFSEKIDQFCEQLPEDIRDQFMTLASEYDYVSPNENTLRIKAANDVNY